MPAAAAPFARPVHNLNAAVPRLAELRSKVVGRDWPAVRAILAGLDDDDDVAIASLTVAETKGCENLLAAALAEAGDGPGGVLPRSLLAYHHIVAGWKIRSGLRAEHVSREQFDRFHARLRQAEQLLIDAVALDPRHTLGWYLRLMTARGLELGQSEARRRYERLAAVNPRHYPAQQQLVQQLCPKWGGSWEAVHAFAEECRSTAEPGGLGHLVTVSAHIEHWLALQGPEKARYWWSEGVRESLVEAAEASVLHPDHRPNMTWVAVHTSLAAAFGMADRPESAARHFEVLGEFSAEYPWNSMSGLPGNEWRRHRDAAFAAAGKDRTA